MSQYLVTVKVEFDDQTIKEVLKGDESDPSIKLMLEDKRLYVQNEIGLLEFSFGKVGLVDLKQVDIEDKMLDKQFEIKGEKTIPIKDVKMADLSPEAVQLAHLYTDVIRQQEYGKLDSGFTDIELDAKRTRIHNKLIAALRNCGVDVSNRLSTTELAEKISRWVPD